MSVKRVDCFSLGSLSAVPTIHVGTESKTIRCLIGSGHPSTPLVRNTRFAQGDAPFYDRATETLGKMPRELVDKDALRDCANDLFNYLAVLEKQEGWDTADAILHCGRGI